MNKNFATDLVKNTFEQGFNRDRFYRFIKELLNKFDESKAFHAHGYVKEKFKKTTEMVKTYERLGTYKDPEGNKIDILIVYIEKKNSLDRARTTLRNFVADYLRQRDMKEAALVAFVSPDFIDWRFSLVKMEYKISQTPSGNIKAKEEFTPAKRFSFLVGPEEHTHTAQSRLAPIIEDDINNPTLKELEDAFSIEKVTKEFFEKYKKLFWDTKVALDAMVAKDAKIKTDFEEKNIDTADFAKKLLGQIVFLYFLQKKGWFGVKREQEWGSGPKGFLRELFQEKHGEYKNFFNDILEPLFYNTLAVERPYDLSDKFNCRIPFLNGGLFDPLNSYDWYNTDIFLPNGLFSNEEKTKEGDEGTGILDVFDRYNFTVKEDEPLEKEVAVDPEMLGKVFENLLEVKDRKSKGTYYTPREIVHYMCQESLINYLLTELDGKVKRDDIETLIRLGETAIEHDKVVLEHGEEKGRYTFKLPQSIRDNAHLLDEKLEKIHVCDPAVGSGAFLVGMMTEVIRVRNVLTNYLPAPRTARQAGLSDNGRPACAVGTADRSIYDFKRHAIQNCLYGVDIDPGAVEIAKLRLWLSLIVDEQDQPAPRLPVQDTQTGQFFVYVIRCGNNSLYIGQTDDLVKRWEQHRSGQASWTSKYKPIEVIHYEIYETRDEAVNREKQLKTGFERKWLKRELGKNRLRKWDYLAARQAGIKQIKPLPNLDYKIMQGNSLLEEYEGIKLFDEELFIKSAFDNTAQINEVKEKMSELQREYFRLHSFKVSNKNKEQEIVDEVERLGKLLKKLASVPKSNSEIISLFPQVSEARQKADELKKLHRKFFETANKREKDEIKKKIEVLEWELIEATLREKNKLSLLPEIERFKKANIKPFFLWKLNFSDVFEKNGGFDIVIANPPYVKEDVNKKAFDGLRSMECYQGKMDLWYLFGDRSLDLLKNSGVMCFIATNNWVSNDGASKFRNKILREAKLNSFIDFGNYKIFLAGIQTMVFILIKNSQLKNYIVSYKKLKNDKLNTDLLTEFLSTKSEKENENFISFPFELSRSDFVDEYINFFPQHIASIINKIKQIGNYYLNDEEIFSGIDVMQDFVGKKHLEKLPDYVTIGDGIFVLSNDEKKRVSWNNKELEIIKPYYTTKEINRYSTDRNNKFWILYTFAQINIEIKQFPNIKRHLDKYKKIITSVNKPYGLHRTREESIFLGDKILSIRKCAEPSFSYVPFPSYVSRAFLIIKPSSISIKYFLGLLNSKLIKFWLLNKGKLQGNQFQIDKIPLMKIPIVTGSEFDQKNMTELVNEILRLSEKDKSFFNFERQIDQIVYKIYGLTTEEIEIVEGKK